MMKNIFCIILLVSVSVLQAKEAIKREISDFSEIKVFDKIEVNLVKSSENKVEITGIKRSEVDIVIKDGILKIKMSLNNLWDENNTKVTVFYTDIEAIDVNEGAVVKSKETIKTDTLELRAQEGGQIFVEVKSDLIAVKSVTGGRINLRGNVREIDVNIQAGGHFYGEGLQSETAIVKVSAGGSVEVRVSKYIKANTNAGGTIKIFGKPREIDSKKVLGGKIIEVN